MGRDHGSCVRQKTKDLLLLIEDPEKVASRRNNSQMTDPHAFLAFNEEKYGGGSNSPRSGWSKPIQDNPSYISSHHPPSGEDTQLQLALEASRQQSIIDAERRASHRNSYDTDLELQAALRISSLEAANSKKSSDDLIDLFQGPSTTSEFHRELSTLSVVPPTQPSYLYHQPQPQPQVQSYEYTASWNNPQPSISASYQFVPEYPNDYNTSSYPNNGESFINADTKYNHLNSTIKDDPFAGLSEVVRRS